MAADFFEKDFNFEKYISERLLEIDDEKTRVEMRELMQHTMIRFIGIQKKPIGDLWSVTGYRRKLPWGVVM